jgi:hypothetical protein
LRQVHPSISRRPDRRCRLGPKYLVRLTALGQLTLPARDRIPNIDRLGEMPNRLLDPVRYNGHGPRQYHAHAWQTGILRDAILCEGRKTHVRSPCPVRLRHMPRVAPRLSPLPAQRILYASRMASETKNKRWTCVANIRAFRRPADVHYHITVRCRQRSRTRQNTHP